MSTAVFPGSFDPFTVGHLDVVERASKIFDRLYVSVLDNPGKSTEFSLDERLELIKDAVGHISNVTVDSSSGLLVDYCKSVGANVIVRGIRTGSDVEYESMLESVNNRICPEIATVYLLSKPEHAYLSSSLVRQLMKIGISIDGLVPDADHIILRRV